MATTAFVADDETIIRMDIEEELAENGILVIGEAADGYDTIERCRATHVNVALIDINMPVIDGLSAARTILTEQLADTVVLITAYSDEKFMKEAGAIGVGGYIVKPLKENTLLPTINIALSQSKRIRNAEESEAKALKEIEDRRVIDRARSAISVHMGYTEKEALTFLQKESMRKGCPLVEYAGIIINAYVDDKSIQKAKQMLMDKYNISENTAYRQIKARSEKEHLSISEAAREILL